jgi:preprotein translocase subunit SecD
MNHYPWWKNLLLLVFVVIGVIYTLPNLYGEDYAVQVSLTESKAIGDDVANKVRDIIKQQGLHYLSVVKVDGQVLARFPDTDDQLKASDFIKAALGDDYIVAPNLAPRTPKWLQAIGANPLKLGLDLRGGVHFLLAVDVDETTKARENGEIHTISNDLRQEKIRYTGITRDAKNGIDISFRDQESLNKAYAYLPAHLADYVVTPDESNGIFKINAKMNEAAQIKLRDYAVEQTMTILVNRINELGVSEAVVQQQGLNKVSVDLPGVQDTARAKEIIGKTASLRFQMVDDEHDLASAQAGVVPMGTRLYDYDGHPILLKNEVILAGSSITYATSALGENGRPTVNVRLGGGGESVFHRTTSESIGKSMAVIYVETKTEKKLIDGKLVTLRMPVEKIISVATIQSALGNNFEITNLSNAQYAQNLALLLRSGAFTAPIEFIQERIVGPSLGKENIKKGVQSILIGIIVVFLFMLMYYRLFGAFADVALLLNVVFVLAILSLIGATLTLPGIAGIVLTIAMAVDANVLINERIREELRNGMSAQASIKAGYERALATIIDSNVSTLIVMIVLFALGSGMVKGFAVTVTIGLFTSMITAVMYSRALVNLVYGRRQVKNLSIGRVVAAKG